MKMINVFGGHQTVVDDGDYEKFNHYQWRLSKAGYVSRREGDKRIFLHREICQTPDGYVTDHINGNKLDNLRSNLRVCLDNENHYNSGIRSDNKSGYRGVCWSKDKKKWSVEIRKNGKKTFLGYHSDIKLAVRTYNTKAKEFFGDFARLNEIPK